MADTFGGLYPCGDGAGYAGNTRAAVDGIQCADSIINEYAPLACASAP